MATQPRPLRADDVPHLPIADPASTGYELVDGELVAIMGASPEHAWLMNEIGRRLGNHVREAGVGAVFTDVWCKLHLPRDPEQLRAPDVAYFSPDKLARRRKGDSFREPPDLAVEIYSPTNYRKGGDFQQRVRDFLDAGTRLLWVIYPDPRYAMVHRADGSAQLVRETQALNGEDVLPEFTLDLGELFRGIP